MSAANATPNAVYGQAYRVYGKIVDLTTGCPITGGLTGLASQISKDGATFVNTSNSAAEIGTSGYFSLDLTIAEMSFSAVVIRVSASNSNAVEYSIVVPICNLQPFTGRFDAQAILRVEQMMLQLWYYFYNQQTIQIGVQTIFEPNATTPIVTGQITADGTGNVTKGLLS